MRPPYTARLLVHVSIRLVGRESKMRGVTIGCEDCAIRLGVLRSALTSLESERNTAMRRWNSGNMSDSDKDDLLASIDVDRTEKNEQLEALEEQQMIKRTQIDYIMNFMGNTYKLWVDADVEMRQRLQNIIFSEGVILNTKTMQFGTSLISPLYRYAPNQHKFGNGRPLRLSCQGKIESIFVGPRYLSDWLFRKMCGRNDMRCVE